MQFFTVLKKKNGNFVPYTQITAKQNNIRSIFNRNLLRTIIAVGKNSVRRVKHIILEPINFSMRVKKKTVL